MKIAELFRVDGQIALVTGGASGIGYACAEAMADNGAAVCIFDRDAAKLAEAKNRLGERSPNIMAEQVDVTDAMLSLLLLGTLTGVSDGVDYNDQTFLTTFPFLALPWEGMDQGHGLPTP